MPRHYTPGVILVLVYDKIQKLDGAKFQDSSGFEHCWYARDVRVDPLAAKYNMHIQLSDDLWRRVS